MIDAMRDSPNSTTEVSQQLAKERKLEFVFDTAGDSNIGMPFILHSEGATDIMNAVIALLAEKPLDDEPSRPEGTAGIAGAGADE